jgi:hypothetical protein
MSQLNYHFQDEVLKSLPSLIKLRTSFNFRLLIFYKLEIKIKASSIQEPLVLQV